MIEQDFGRKTGSRFSEILLSGAKMTGLRTGKAPSRSAIGAYKLRS